MANTEIKERYHLPVSVSAAVLIENNQGELLLVQQSSEDKGNKWSPPGGRLIAYENPIGLAERECLEEIGTKVVITDLIGVYTSPRGDHATGLAFVFRGKLNEGSEIKLKMDEVKDWKFLSPQELDKLEEADLLYKPEYTIPSLHDWKKGQFYPIEAIKPIAEKVN